MRKRIRTNLRASRPLRLESFEDRCLLSGAGFSLAPSLLPPRLLTPPTIPTPGLIHTAAPTVRQVGAVVHTGAVVPHEAGLFALASGVNPVVDLALGALNSPGVFNASAQIGLGNIGAINAALAVASSGGLIGNIDITSAGMIGIGINASGQSLLGVPVSPLVVVSVPTIGAPGVSAGAGALHLHVDLGSATPPALDIEPAASVNLNVGGTPSPIVGVKLYAGPLPGDSLELLVRADVDHGQPQGIHLQANETISVGGAPVPIAVTTSQESPHAEMPFTLDDEPRNDVIPGPAHSAATPEMALQNSQLFLVSPLQTSFVNAVLNDLAAEAEVMALGSIDRPGEASQTTINGGASEVDGDSAIPFPRSEGPLSNLRALDLAALEGDMQAFLEQIEHLGGELSSLLARMNLSPWLVATAVAAVAGELTRRRLQGPRRRPLLAACEGASFAWFPGLAGPWSREEL